MLKRKIVFGLCMAFALPVSSQGFTDFKINGETVRSILTAAKDGHFRLTLRKAHQALDLVRDLRSYADQVSESSERLRQEMLDDHYEDWVNTKLLPLQYEARALKEIMKKAVELEKNNVEAALKQARGGDYGPIEGVLARIHKARQEYEARVKAVEAQVNSLRKEYSRHLGNARAALSQFSQLPIVQDLLNSKPKLVKKIELAPAAVRPLQWVVHLVKERKDYNDPRFAQIPRSIILQDGQETLTYPVVIR